MKNVKKAGKPDHFKLPVGFDAKKILDQSFGGFFSTGPAKTVRVCITGYMVDYLRNRVLQPKQKVSMSADGKSMEISFLAGSTGPVPFGNAGAWVLSMGPCAKVIEPPELIDRVKLEARQLLKQYR